MEDFLSQTPKINKHSNKKKLAAVATIIVIVGALAVFYSWDLRTRKVQGLIDIELEKAEFDEFLERFGKFYKDEAEYIKRFNIFRTNSAYIRVQNTMLDTWTMAVNMFADMTHDEFSSIYLGAKVSFDSNIETENLNINLENSVDWRSTNKVTPIKNQGYCGSCWAFSATGAIESAVAIKGKGLIPLSQQQLVDCSWSYGNQGCNGGWMDQAFEYVKSKGLATEKNYLYTGVDGSCSKTKESKVSTKITKFVNVLANDSNQLLMAISINPVSVGVDADTWAYYSSGIITGSTCGTAINHGVLVIGYSQSEKYYIVKNSWGTTWGEQGYIRLSIESGAGACSVQSYPSYPVV